MELKSSYDFVSRFVQAAVRYHPFFWFFVGGSLEKTRVLRFLTALKSVLLSIFISTIFYSVYFPVGSICSNYNNTTSEQCLAQPSKILSGESECTWTPSSATCSLKPPPDSAAFIISVAILTTVIFAPLDLFVFLLMNVVCNRRPVLEAVGMDSFFWLGGYSDPKLKTSMDITTATSYILRALHAYEMRLIDDKCSTNEQAKMNTILSSLGAHFNTVCRFPSFLFRSSSEKLQS